jgi:two-component system sensor histidine kinase DcuS
MVPVKSQDRVIGAITTFRDKTEISQLMQRIDGMVNYVDALRSHTHEFMNKLHVILGLLHEALRQAGRVHHPDGT